MPDNAYPPGLAALILEVVSWLATIAIKQEQETGRLATRGVIIEVEMSNINRLSAQRRGESPQDCSPAEIAKETTMPLAVVLDAIEELLVPGKV